jgi:hypothetical protein
MSDSVYDPYGNRYIIWCFSCFTNLEAHMLCSLVNGTQYAVLAPNFGLVS